MTEIFLYTDGACSGNPGAGGYAAILLFKEYEKTISGCHPDTTNNRMELTAVIEGLKAIKNKDIPVHVFTDSMYVKQGITDWIDGWKQRHWKKVKNQDLWKELDALTHSFKTIRFSHVKGHSGDTYNELCDKEARKQIDQCR